MSSKSKSSALKVLQPTLSGSKLVGDKDRAHKLNPTKHPPADPTKKKRILGQLTAKSKGKSVDASVGTEMGGGGVVAETNTDVSLPLDPGRADSLSGVREMLLGARPNERYLEVLAEERRKALEASLEENLALSQEVARLREENRELRAVAEEGMRYAEILKEALDQDSHNND